MTFASEHFQLIHVTGPKPETVADVLAAYDEWATARVELSERETDDAGNIPSANEWEASDDIGHDIAHRLASTIRTHTQEAS